MLAHNITIHTLVTWNMGSRARGGARNALAIIAALVDNMRIRTLTIKCHVSSMYPSTMCGVDLENIFRAVSDMIAANQCIDDLTVSCSPWHATAPNPMSTRFAKMLSPALCSNTTIDRFTLIHQDASVLFTAEPCFLEVSSISYLNLTFNLPPPNYPHLYTDLRSQGFRRSVVAAIARAAEKDALNIEVLEGVVELRNYLDMLGLDEEDDDDDDELTDNTIILAALKPMFVLK